MQSEGVQEANPEPTTIKVRTEGLKLDLVVLNNKVSGLSIDYQSISRSGELQRWIKIIDGMISGSAPSPKIKKTRTPEEMPSPLTSQSGGPKEEPVELPSEPMKELPAEPFKEPQIEPQPELRLEPRMEPSDELPPVTTIEPPKEHSVEPMEEPSVEPPIERSSELPLEPLEEPDGESVSEPLLEPPSGLDYRKIVIDAVDSSLDSLGRDGKYAIMSLLENRYGLREQDIPEHPGDFILLLEGTLGASAETLEREMMLNIRVVADAPGEDLEEVVNFLKEQNPIKPRRRIGADGSNSSTSGAKGFRYDATYFRRRD